MLGRWLNRLEHPTKNGTNIELHYKFTSTDPYDLRLLHDWAAGTRALQTHMVVGRKKTELGKILAVMSKSPSRT
ncbi:hypothetical protein LTR65_004791 [Meristemomyces frigidus]